jgi:hypothetical protein
VLRIDDTTIRQPLGKETASVASFESDHGQMPPSYQSVENTPPAAPKFAPEQPTHNPWGDNDAPEEPLPFLPGHRPPNAGHQAPPTGQMPKSHKSVENTPPTAPKFAPEHPTHNPWADDDAPEEPVPFHRPPTTGHQAPATGHSPQRDCCARCGRPFRGEWDRHPRSDEIVCNICANLAEHMAAPVLAPRLPQHTVAPPTREELREMRGLQDRPPPPDPNRYRGLKPFLIVFGVTMLAILVLPVEDWVAWLSERRFHNRPEALSPVWNRVLWSLVLVFIFLKEWLAVFLALLSERPKDRDAFLMEAITAAKYAVILSIFAYGFLFIFAGPGGFGPIGLAFLALHIFLPPLVLWAFTDLDGSTVLLIFVFRAIVEPFMPLIKWSILGILGILAT